MTNRHFSSYYLVPPFEYEAWFQVLQTLNSPIQNDASMSLSFENKEINPFGAEREALERGVDPRTRGFCWLVRRSGLVLRVW
jgi:hypothetical protein